MAEVKFYRCNHCGNIVAVVKDGGVTPSCCGEPMELLVAGSTDAATEKQCRWSRRTATTSSCAWARSPTP